MDHCVVEAKFHTGENLMQYARAYPISPVFEFGELNKISLKDNNKREWIKYVVMRSFDESVFCQIRYIRLSKLQLFVKTKVTKHVEWPMDKIAIEKICNSNRNTIQSV